MEEHGPAPGARQLLLDLEALEIMNGGSTRQDLCKLLPQSGDVPPTVSELGEVTALRVLPRDLKLLAEGAARGAHPQLPVEHQERFLEGVGETLVGGPPVAVPAAPVRRAWSAHRPLGNRFGTRARLAIRAWLGNVHSLSFFRYSQRPEALSSERFSNLDPIPRAVKRAFYGAGAG